MHHLILVKLFWWPDLRELFLICLRCKRTRILFLDMFDLLLNSLSIVALSFIFLQSFNNLRPNFLFLSLTIVMRFLNSEIHDTWVDWSSWKFPIEKTSSQIWNWTGSSFCSLLFRAVCEFVLKKTCIVEGFWMRLLIKQILSFEAQFSLSRLP